MNTEPTSWHDVSAGSVGLPPYPLKSHLDLQALAAQQGVSPIDDPDVLLGDFWPDDETIDDFLGALRTSRRDAAM
ncbi:MAG TPA: hypothetical protein VJ828_18880 [Lacipirellulaceae bacterium]|nr:hypothetical protein [Lacipirellulaceae bacterium]